MRRGELLALRWQDVDLKGATVRVERTLEKTVKLGYRFKQPKTRQSRRTISLPPTAVADAQRHPQGAARDRSCTSAWASQIQTRSCSVDMTATT